MTKEDRKLKYVAPLEIDHVHKTNNGSDTSTEYLSLKPSAEEDNESNSKPWFPNNGSWIDKIFKIFEDPNASIISFFCSLCIILIIVVSSVGFVLQTEPKWRYPIFSEDPQGTPYVLGCVEKISMYIFAFEYIARISCAPFVSWEALEVDVTVVRRKSCLSPRVRKLWLWFKRKMNLVDLFAVAPYYVTLCLSEQGNGYGVLRILRLSRVFRVFKMAKYSENVALYAEMINGSITALTLLFFFSLLNAIVFGSLIFFVESGEYDEDSAAFVVYDSWGNKVVSEWFTSISQSFYWVFVTTTTVGYGDMYPVTSWGKVCAVIIMHLGILAIAMPVTIIGSNFQGMMERKEKRKNEEIIQISKSQDRFLHHVKKIKKLSFQLLEFEAQLDTITKSLLDARAVMQQSSKRSSAGSLHQQIVIERTKPPGNPIDCISALNKPR